MERELISYIKKSHIKALDRFREELQAFAKETGEEAPTLYENANTSFTLANITISNDGKLLYDYDGKTESEVEVIWDEEENDYFENIGSESIMSYISFWRKCLNKAKKYWAMDPAKLDAIQDGEVEEEDDEEED